MDLKCTLSASCENSLLSCPLVIRSHRIDVSTMSEQGLCVKLSLLAAGGSLILNVKAPECSALLV